MEHDPKLFDLSSCSLESDPGGLVSHLRMPGRSTNERSSTTRDLLTIHAMIRAKDPKIGRYLSFIPHDETCEEAADQDRPSDTDLQEILWDDIPRGPIRLAILREDGCTSTGLALAHHVVFARKEAQFDARLLALPSVRQIAAGRTRSTLPALSTITAEELLELGFVDHLFEGAPIDVARDYARRHEGRWNGESALYEVQRLHRRRTSMTPERSGRIDAPETQVAA